ncbi:MAG: hypothetical protein N2644_06400 [Candidatus Sumerlaea chitinivorans]|jgi:hypothetical protein|uniref:Uncharacterized protein n=1 Tax=Sumerlaea chitinivorans TaxID=2250252 RepID=A0A2Z4Y682_SUMC1|nr:hypothetical protein BRCON_1933 [Candidatus Sumerlaea chitinivorans]MCX7964094.1 hypothetical protein [Candidatus Sumerlaea chitinivorans]
MSEPLPQNLYEKRTSTEWPRTRDVQPRLHHSGRYPLPLIDFMQNIRKP